MADPRVGFATLAALVKERGWRLTALLALFHLLDKSSAGRVRLVSYALVAQPLGVGLNPVRDDPQTVVHQVDPQDPVTSLFPRPAHINLRRWQSGATCHVVKVKDQFAGTLWLQREAYEEDEIRALFVLADPGHTVWDFDVYVTPRYRLGRTMARLWKAVDAELSASGVRWSFSRISLFNPESLKSHARLGAVTVRRAWFLCAGRLQLSVWGGAPFVHLGWSEQQRPRIVLRAPHRP